MSIDAEVERKRFEKWWLSEGWLSGSEKTTDAFDAIRASLSACVAEWRPISEAPRDGTVVELGNAHGTWYAKWRPVYASGFPNTQPWVSMMLNHEHIVQGHRYDEPTHFRALTPPPTTETEGETK